MQLSPSDSERFLAGFHDADPGATSRAFADLPASMAGTAFASSYECLASVVPADTHTVLDLACGDGFLLSLLAARRQPGLSLVGVDLSAGELAAARRRLGDAAVLHQARAQALPLADACADTVLCHMALMLMDDAPQVLAEVQRVLKLGGMFAAIVGATPISSPAHDAFVALLRQHRRLPQFEALRLGDRRLNNPQEIAELFLGTFDPPAVDDILLQWCCSPAALWGWFGTMYDMAWLAAADRAEIGRLFPHAVQTLCDADGNVQSIVRLRRITVRAPAAGTSGATHC